MFVVDDIGAAYPLAACFRAANGARVSAIDVICAPWRYGVEPVRMFILSDLPVGLERVPLSAGQRLLVSCLWRAYPCAVNESRLAALSGGDLPSDSSLRHMVRALRGKLVGSGWCVETVRGCGWRLSDAR